MRFLEDRVGLVEQVFGIPGIGRYFVQGALNRDYTLVLGVVLVIAVPGAATVTHDPYWEKVAR